MNANAPKPAEAHLLVTLVCEGSMRAAARMLHTERFRPLADAPEIDARLAEALRRTIKETWTDLQTEWREALAANLGEKWTEAMVNTQCNAIALCALKSLEPAR